MELEKAYMKLLFQLLKTYAKYLLLLFIVVFPCEGRGQEKKAANTGQDSLIAAACEIMKSAYYCALVTVDTSGQPQVRVMEPFPPEEDMVVWFGTNSKSRKVHQIRHDSRVSLFYFDPDGVGYVTITGTDRLVNDEKEIAPRWKEGWEEFYPDREDNYLLIEVTPKRLEIISLKHGIIGDSETWTPPSIEFNINKTKEPEKK